VGVPTWECLRGSATLPLHRIGAGSRRSTTPRARSASRQRITRAPHPSSASPAAAPAEGSAVRTLHRVLGNGRGCVQSAPVCSLASRRRWMGMRDAWVELERNPLSADLLTSARAAALCTHRLHERQGEGRGLLRHEVQRARRPAQGLRGLLGKARRGPEELLVRALWS
jgi:hypothetical protein